MDVCIREECLKMLFNQRCPWNNNYRYQIQNDNFSCNQSKNKIANTGLVLYYSRLQIIFEAFWITNFGRV